ncbi:pancreatic lipase-related protein 2-like [Anopheles aquasalis]|uniref:pancreatic lipase-related protein 2-like n=1 Tax=Anopheles aquasalis TaxID=42839 RepID=UPI00215A7E5E|nr:pancreatic lipase-related protein 2-like [Anopheles aquasalis]XP_050091086.1 pancreatic lipase-related protein 2-like [Anopheles aquasalis]XP_050091087.1 pancreatic lipase-related protein 2-like [Anopheles aquasalis]XP_050091088.1 pancreatic lipase-related protein 2-like [Anopheles aquasalis]
MFHRSGRLVTLLSITLLIVGCAIHICYAGNGELSEVRIGFGSSFSARRDVRFHLYTPLNTADAHVFSIDTVDTLMRSFYNSSHPVRIIIHGWFNNATSLVIQGIKDAYLSAGSYNVIGVDWGTGASESYFRASQYTIAVGLVVADLINQLVRSNMTTMERLHLVGHSLGAHIAGNTGHSLKTAQLQVIYGLDPASINFFQDEPETRLSPDDAAYVEVIHTNTQFSGYPAPIGHVDFYMNYGRKQPGCKTDVCSHGRSTEFFMESLSNTTKGFWGVACADYNEIKSRSCYNIKQQALMGGEYRQKNVTAGVYTVETLAEAPYAMGYVH